MLSDLTGRQRNSPEVYTYFLKNWDPARHERIIERYSRFIDSGCEYMTVKDPVNKQFPYVKEEGYLS